MRGDLSCRALLRMHLATCAHLDGRQRSEGENNCAVINPCLDLSSDQKFHLYIFLRILPLLIRCRRVTVFSQL